MWKSDSPARHRLPYSENARTLVSGWRSPGRASTGLSLLRPDLWSHLCLWPRLRRKEEGIKEAAREEGACTGLWHSKVRTAMTSYRLGRESAFDARHQLLDLHFLLAGERQEWQPRRASIVAVEVHGVLHAGDAEVTNHALGGQSHTLLLFAGERVVSIFDGSIDFVTRHGRGTGEGENAADRSQTKRRFKLGSGANHDLEANVFLPRLQFAYDGYRRGRRFCTAAFAFADGRGRPSLYRFRRTRERGDADQFPALFLAFRGCCLEHARCHGIECFRHGGLPFYLTRALDQLLHFVEVAARFLDGDNAGMVCEFDYEFGGHVVSGGLREVVDDDRERRPVCYRTIESEQARGQHLLFVIVRRAN